MRQHQDSPTTEDIAAVERPGDREEARADGDRFEPDAVETHHADAERDESDLVDSERVDSSHVDADDLDSDDLDSDHLDSGHVDSGHVDSDRIDSDRVDTDQDETDRAESERFDANRTGSHHIGSDDRIGTDPTGSVDRAESEQAETVDETAWPADNTLAGQTRPHETASRENTADLLFDEADAARFRDRWREVQTGFVDDPKQAVQDADVLVAELMQNLASAFSDRKRVLEDKWREGTDAETEDLRLALRGYRSFLDQLLAH